ncbi:MAG TPA: non-homologous end-joining DNA ligase [Chitinivibrionales bacterium]|jgi:bifunctional non-homologous end joining protein LigD|nr:non-homologous end-joining DNA ligase [Chitinivibrionales bacterium]
MNKTVSINDRELWLTNLDKDLYPSYGFAKTRILEYYSLIAPFMLPFLKDRALTLKRYPEGVGQDFFFEKRCPKHRPAWLETAEIPYGDRKRITYCVANNLETLIWVGNLASIELHVPLAKAASPDNPDSVVFDLDPGVGADVLDCARVALVVKDLLSDLKLESFAKTSGKKGLHVFVPLDPKKTNFENTKSFSKAVAGILQKNYPDLVTARMNKEYRKNKVFINWSQNDASKTMVCVYSLRAAEKPAVSFPLAWKDLEKRALEKDPEKFQVLAPDAVTKAVGKGDFYREMLDKKQRLPNTWA